jgi:hypothetical protein
MPLRRLKRNSIALKLTTYKAFHWATVNAKFSSNSAYLANITYSAPSYPARLSLDRSFTVAGGFKVQLFYSQVGSQAIRKRRKKGNNARQLTIAMRTLYLSPLN